MARILRILQARILGNGRTEFMQQTRTAALRVSDLTIYRIASIVRVILSALRVYASPCNKLMLVPVPAAPRRE